MPANTVPGTENAVRADCTPRRNTGQRSVRDYRSDLCGLGIFTGDARRYSGYLNDMTTPTRLQLLTWMLRIVGGVELLAVPFILLPFAWMNHVHERILGLGTLPAAPITEYMARSLSVMYALHGAIVMRLSFDVPRFQPLIHLLGMLHVALGGVVLGIDIVAGLPVWWIAGEGPGIALGGAIILALSRGLLADRSQ